MKTELNNKYEKVMLEVELRNQEEKKQLQKTFEA
jgi:hypothetical protein